MVFASFFSDRAALRPAVGGLILICALGVCPKTLGQIPLPVRTEYQASAWLHVCRSAPKILFDVHSGDEALWSHETQLALVKSRFVLSASLRKPGVSQLEYLREKEDRLTWLKRHVEARFLDNTEILEIAMSGDDPSQLVTLVNAVKDAYMEEVVGVERENQLRRKRLLDVSYGRNLEEIKKKTDRLGELRKQLGLGPAAVAIGPLRTGESLAEIRERAARRGEEIRVLKRRTAVLKSRLARFRPPDSGAKHTGEKLPVPGPQPKAAGAAESPLSAQQRHEIWNNAMKGIAPPPDTPSDLLEAIVAHLETETGVIEEELKTARADLEKAAGELEQKAPVELELRQAELEQLKKVTAEMGLALEKWEVELAAAPRVSVLVPAHVPRTGTPRIQLPDWLHRAPDEGSNRKPLSKASE